MMLVLVHFFMIVVDYFAAVSSSASLSVVV